MATLTTSWQSLGSATLYTGITVHLDGKIVSQSTGNNTSSVQFRLRSVGSKWRTTSGTAKFTGAYTDSKSCATYPDYINDGSTIFSISKPVKHNDDGTKSISIGGSVQAYIDGSSRTATISNKTATLPKINRLATITSASDFTDEENPTIQFNNPAGFTVYPYLNFYDEAGTKVYGLYRNSSSATSPYTWNITDAERTAMREATNKQQKYSVSIGVDTYNGSTKLGYNSKSYTMTYVNAEPSQSTTFTETNSKVISVLGTSNANTIIQNVSQIKLTSTPTVKKGATVTKITFEHNGKLTDDPTSPYEQTYIPVNNKVKVTITDSRGYSTSTEYTKTMVEYLPIDISSRSFKRQSPTSSNIVLNAEIRYKQTTFASKTNSPTIQWKLGADGTLKTISSSNYTIDSANNKIIISNLVLENVLSYTTPGEFYLYANDLLTEDKENAFPVPKGIPTFDAGEHDFKVNGELYVANQEGKNKRNVLTEIDTLNANVKDSGWKNLTLNSTCTTGGYSGTPQYRKIGNHVYIRGSVSVTASSSTLLLANIPEGFRPSSFFYKTNMAGGNCVWRQTIGETGNINCEWIIDMVAGSKKTSGTIWLELNIDFLID